METLTRQPLLEWSVESLPYAGSTETGDRAQVRESGQSSFVFVLDALGHGHEASRMADLAESLLERTDADVPLERIFETCHREWQGTRGAALCLARLEPALKRLSWLSVGNIQGVHIQLDRHGMPQFESLIMRGGVVGDRLPELRASHTALEPGDTIVLATDGVGYGWYGEYRPNIPAAALAEAIRHRHCHGKDDALVIALRFNGTDEGAG